MGDTRRTFPADDTKKEGKYIVRGATHCLLSKLLLNVVVQNSRCSAAPLEAGLIVQKAPVQPGGNIT